jgi:hypothetical protein
MATNDPNIATNDPYNIQIPGQNPNPIQATGVPPAGSPGLPIPGMSNLPNLGTGPNNTSPNTGGVAGAMGVPMSNLPNLGTGPGNVSPNTGGVAADASGYGSTGTAPATAGTDTSAAGPDMSTAALTAMMEQYGAAQGRSPADLASTEASDAAYWIPKIQAGGPSQLAYWQSRMQSPPGQGSNAPGVNTPASTAAGTSTYVPMPTAAVAPAAAPTTTSSAIGGTTPGQGTDLYNMLMTRASQSEIIDPNDPTIKAQVDPQVAQLQRANQQNLAADAERAGSNANIGAETRAGAENVGTQAAGIEGAVMGQQLAARQAEIQQALSGAQGLLTNEQQMNLQEELAKLQLAQQQNQFTQSQGQQLGEYTQGQAQQAAQFGQTLGQNAYQFGTNTQLNAAGL